MKDSDWEILYRLYKTPNITKVANMLYISQPSLTRRLKGIEEEFNIKIVSRTSKGVTFTPEGEYLAKKAENYMDFIKEIKNEENEKNRNRTVHRIGSNLFNRFRICPFRYFWWQDPDVYDGVWSYGRHCFLLLRRVWNCGENGRQDSKMGLAHRTISI